MVPVEFGGDGSRICADDVRVAKNLGTDAPSASLSAATPAAAPPAVRATRPGWRDPRLWLGVAIVAACVVAGARILGSADDTVEVWALAHDEGPGVELTQDDLRVERVRFADDADLHRYFRADAELPDHLQLSHELGKGDMLPRSAVVDGTDATTAEVPLPLDPGQVPPTVAPGSVVDIYLNGKGAGAQDDNGPVLSGVTVVSVVDAAESLSASGQEQLTLAVPINEVGPFLAHFSGSADEGPVVHVVRTR